MQEPLTSREAVLVLNAVSGVGPVLYRRLMETFGSPERILEADEYALTRVEGVGPKTAQAIRDWATTFSLSKEKRLLLDWGAVFLTPDDAAFPPLLRKIYDCPLGLYMLGDVMCLKKPCVSIVGSRRSTLYGISVAKKLAAGLARAGFCVVSGMARGIDAAAHEGALEAGGSTLAVLGSGIDIVYPPENKELYDAIRQKGLIVSEFPFGRTVNRQTFPMRNRIISGLSEAVIVVESAIHGGSMITANTAGEQGRTLMAIPGRIDQVSSQGCHQLIRDGAILVTSVEDVLEELAYGAQQLEMPLPSASKPRPATVLSLLEQKIYQALADGACVGLDALAERTGMPISDVASTLLLLELKKQVVKRADGTFEARVFA